jgi:Crp-like helix-turn-helix domain
VQLIDLAGRPSQRARDRAGKREITITQKDLGNIIGMSLQSTNKQRRIWEDKKWVRLERNPVVILAIDHLATIAGLEVEPPQRPRQAGRPRPIGRRSSAA